MSYEKNPLEKFPSSRGGSKERIINDDSEYKEVVRDEQGDGRDEYEKKYIKRTRIDLEGKELPQVYGSVEAIPDDRLLPDQFEDVEDKERDDYIKKYNTQHKDQYKIKQTNKKISDNVEKVSLEYNNSRGKAFRDVRRAAVKRKAA